ncbi:hypothetical protein A6A27_32365 [Micromonospora sp. CB01531]|nr:hypothetical protein A6A27_32365 [Micromonospora sp. CB01531]
MRRWLVPLIVLSVVVACGAVVLFPDSLGRWVPLLEYQEPVQQLIVRNERTGELSIRVESPSGISTRTVPAGGMESFGEATCRATLLIAYDANGSEISRLDLVGCTTKTWIFTADGRVRLEDDRVFRTS